MTYVTLSKILFCQKRLEITFFETKDFIIANFWSSWFKSDTYSEMFLGSSTNTINSEMTDDNDSNYDYIEIRKLFFIHHHFVLIVKIGNTNQKTNLS